MRSMLFFAVFSLIYSHTAAQGIIYTIAGNGVTQYIGDGWPATAYSLAAPSGVVVDKTGNVLVTDYADSRIRRIANDTLYTINDTSGVPGYSGDGGVLAGARFNNPSGLCIDTSGNLFISEEFNNVVRRVDKATGIVATICGSPAGGFSGDGGPATSAQMNQPEGICVDHDGNIFVADKGNNRVRKVSLATGVITTVAGTGTAGYSGDNGPATAARLSAPWGVAADAAGNILIADYGNNRIRRIDATTGVIVTVAGSGISGYSGDGGAATAARFRTPNNVFVDTHDRIYVSDFGNNVIRRITEGGIISTVAGNGSNGYSGDGGPATAAALYGPTAVFVTDSGTLFIADGTNSAIRKVSSITTGIHGIYNTGLVSVYPNPSTGVFTVQRAAFNVATIAVYNIQGQKVYETPAYNSTAQIDITGSPPGIYFVYIRSESNSYCLKVLLQ